MWQVMFAGPLMAHRIRRRKTRGVIDHGPTAQRRALQHDQPEIARREQAAGVIHRPKRVGLSMGEIGLVLVAALYQNDDVLTRGVELRGDDAAARARADDHDVAAERRIRSDNERLDGFRDARRRAEWPGIAEAVCAGRGGVVSDRSQTLECLKCFSPLW